MLTFTNQLDRIEATLPPIPARIMRLQRTIATATVDQFGAAIQTLLGASRSVVGTARISGRTVAGQTRAAGTDIVANAQRNAKQVVGQAKAQGRRVSATAEREVSDVIDAAADAVSDRVAGAADGDRVAGAADGDRVAGAPGSGKRYEQWTKAELLERAKQLDLEGRHGLNKKQLITALRNA